MLFLRVNLYFTLEESLLISSLMKTLANRIIIPFLLILLISCGTNYNLSSLQAESAYDIINKTEYVNKGLFYRTIGDTDFNFILSKNFNYEAINENNYEKYWLLDDEPFRDFDSIFNKQQQESIDKKISELSSVKLKKGSLANSHATTRKKDAVKITYPIFQRGKNGDVYAFIYKDLSVEGILYIYKKTETGWEEFAKVEIFMA